MNLTEYLGKLDKPVLVTIGCVLVALASIADFLSGPGFNSSLLYLIPVSFFAWYIGRGAGLVTSAISAAIRFASHSANFPSIAHSGVLYANGIAWLGLYIFLVLMIAELRSLYQRERFFSHVDSLTRIPNRRAFFESLSAEKNRASRYHLPLTIAYIDLDHFKEINDRFGHSTGDEILILVANTMQEHVRQFDMIARLGGDEFALLLPDTGEAAAGVVLQKLHDLLEEAMRKRNWPITFSIGVVTFSPPPLSVEEMINRADQAMYEAKIRGRNRIVGRSVA